VWLCDDFHFPKFHAADQSETKVSHEELGDLLVREIGAREIEPKSLSGEPPAVGELNLSVEVGTVFGHSAGV
jgi:hypothetical protein